MYTQDRPVRQTTVWRETLVVGKNGELQYGVCPMHLSFKVT